MGMAAVNVAIPSLAGDLQATAAQVGWLPTLYLLGNVGFMLPCGKLADMYGRKRMYSAGLLLNAVAALFCAFASSIEVILVWRFFQGVAGAMIFGTGIAIVTSVTPAHKRGSALGIVASCVYVGLTAAPGVGGYLTEWLGWRAVFYFQVPFVMALLVLIKLRLPGEWKAASSTGFDRWGSLAFMAFACCLVLGLSDLMQTRGWLYLCGAVMALVVFIIRQQVSSRPLLRLSLFQQNRVLGFSLSASFFMYGSNFAIVFLLSLYLQYIKGFTPSEAGNVLLVQALCMAVVAPFAGKLADNIAARWIATMGCSLVALGFLCLNQIDASSTALYVSLSLALMGVGFGLFSTPNNNAIMGAVPATDIGIASASMNLARTLGNLFGMSLVNLLLQYHLGDVALDAGQQQTLMVTISFALQLSLAWVLVAMLCSACRGPDPARIHQP